MNEETIFAVARQWKDGAARKNFLDQACAGQPQLRAQVEGLLRADAQAGSLLEHPAGGDVRTNLESEKSRADDTETDSVNLSFLSPSDKLGCIGRLGTYDVLEVIGRGGMGIVLRGLDLKLNRIVAMKVLAPELAANAMARKRFLREAQAAAAISHDHVVTIHAVDDDIAVPFLVMECIIGQSLQQKIDRVGALQLTEILRIGMQISLGLAAAHKQGLIHRDIKPANILLENGVERVKITDFGLARATDDVGITQSGVIAGTPQYMSPEQAMGNPIDQRSDLFSLGSVFYTMCTGRPAFRADSTIAVIRRVCDDTPRPIFDLNPEIPDWFVAIVDKLLAKEPNERFQTAAEVANLLEQQLAEIQQSSAASGHRAALRRKQVSSPPERPVRSRADFIWSCVGMLTLGLMLVGWSVKVLSMRAAPDVHVAIPAGASVEISKPQSADIEVQPPNSLGQEKKTGDLKAAQNAPLIDGQPLAQTPFDSRQAAKYQTDWANHLGVPVEFKNAMGMKFRLIPPGEFLMGSTPEETADLIQVLEQTGASEFEKFSARSSSPRHRVRLTAPYYMGQYEVTVAQFRQFAESSEGKIEKPADAHLSWTSFNDQGHEDRQPVLGVSWDEAQGFAMWLSQRENLSYSLPTEAQWEFACRAGSQSLWSFGDDLSLLESHAITGLNGTPRPISTGLKNANPFGLYDMHGNVDEWCLDWHDQSFYSQSPFENPVFLEQPKDPASGRVARGGSWNSSPWWSRSAVRAYDFPSNPVHPKGFRIVIQGNIESLRNR